MKKGKQPTIKQLDKRLLINVMFLIVTFIILLNLFLLFQINKGIVPSSGPITLEFIAIIDENCADCIDIGDFKDDLHLDRFEIKNESVLKFTEAQDIISQYEIQRIPALVIKSSQEIYLPFPKVNGAYVFDYSEPPYVDPHTGQIKGFIDATIIEAPNCDVCTTPDQLVDQIKDIVKISQIAHVDPSSDKGIELMMKYQIKKLPVIILSKDAEEYKVIQNQWSRVGIQAEDGSFIMTKTPPPFLDTQTNEIKGLVTMTVITDKGCTYCYDPIVHQNNLNQLGMVVKNYEEFDVSLEQAKDLIQTYEITQLPAILLSKEAREFTAVNEIWNEVGTIEHDGTYVFRNHQSIEGAMTKKI